MSPELTAQFTSVLDWIVAGTPKVPDGTVVTMQVVDDTLPGGPRTLERRFVAPFARASRVADYRLAWAFFASAENVPQDQTGA